MTRRDLTYATKKTQANLKRIRELAALGLNVKQIAPRVGLCDNTVRRYVAHHSIKIAWRDSLRRYCAECDRWFTNAHEFSAHQLRRSKRYPKRPLLPVCRTDEQLLAAGWKLTARGWLTTRPVRVSRLSSSVSSAGLQELRP